MADEFVTKLYLGLHDLLAATVLTPRERKFVEIINTQNAVLEKIASGTLTKSPQEIANLAKAATVVIVEKGSDPVSVERYAAKVAAENSAENRQEPENPVNLADQSVEERIRAFSAFAAAGKPKLVDLPPGSSPGAGAGSELPATVGGGLAPPRRRQPEG